MTMRRNEQPQQRPGGGGGPRPSAATGAPSFWDSYLSEGYFDKDGNLRPKLVVEDAIEIARRLAQGRTGTREGFAPAQLRRFYSMAKYLEDRLDAGIPFASVVADLRSLQPLAADAVAKDKAPAELLGFMDKNIELAYKDEAAFRRGFLVHFQSVVAYFNYEKKMGGNR